MTIRTFSEKETRSLAARLAERLKGGEVILLDGRLGAGKTAFTKGIAEGLGVKKTVTSPTFTIMKEYDGRLLLRHFDMYRIGDASEMEELGIAETLFDKDAVCVIEWYKFENLSPVIRAKFEYVGENERLITIEGAEL